jgi:hypothetical protein
LPVAFIDPLIRQEWLLDWNQSIDHAAVWIAHFDYSIVLIVRGRYHDSHDVGNIRVLIRIIAVVVVVVVVVVNSNARIKATCHMAICPTSQTFGLFAFQIQNWYEQMSRTEVRTETLSTVTVD